MNTQISSLIEDQLPDFISADYENVSVVLEAYYQQLESVGQPLDIITNITQYRDVDFYEKNILKERTVLSTYLNSSATTILVEDASSFPLKNGYIRINNEICFYKERTDTELLEVSRGVSGTTTLGDLYSSSKFISTEASMHQAGSSVDNLSHLFLYAFVKSFEKEYLDSFPEAYLKEDVDKRTLIKNIASFYKTKGTDKSIRFIFNTIISKSADDIPTTYNPKDFTLKTSTSDWQSYYALQAIVLQGNPEWLIGETLIQQPDKNLPNISYASSLIENIIQIGRIDNYPLFELVLNPASINGAFVVPQQTVLKRTVTPSMSAGATVTVDSTFGWKDREGTVVINGEVIKYSGKSLNQFYIKERGNINRTHGVGDFVYNYSTATAKTENGNVTVLIYGILSSLTINSTAPYASPGDSVQISKPGFETIDTIIFDKNTQNYRWKINTNGASPSVPLNPPVGLSLQKYLADVSSVYEDNEYFYIATSSYPSTEILTSSVDKPLSDPKLLKLIPKSTTTTTEVYQTSKRDIGVFVDGSIAFSAKDEDLIKYGQITKFNVLRRGSGYSKSPFVLINGEPRKARAYLIGDVVDRVETSSIDNYTAPPVIELISGRNAVVQAVVTSGTISSLRIINPGEYYSAPPTIIITDITGRGRLAEYKAVVSIDGKIVDTIKVDGGKLYSQENVRVTVIEEARSNPAVVTANIKEWTKNRYFGNQASIDSNGGIVVKDIKENEYYYGVIANPKRLRKRLDDNLTSTFQESSILKHSPILGYAYDGNPIYGPYGYSNPLNSQSQVVRMQSSYVLKSSRTNGPVGAPYPMGTFVDDYEWRPSVLVGKTKLDKNNGRFCITPEYPTGVYAYFITINSDNTPVYPYILGENFISLPVQSNYKEKITQDNLPQNVRRLFVPGTLKNGDNEIAIIDSVSFGSIKSVTIEDSQPIYSVGSRVYVDDSGSGGSGASGIVSATFGKQVNSVESKQIKATILTSSSALYSFDGDIITQEQSGATGELIRDVVEETIFTMRNVQGSFVPGLSVFSSSKVINLLLSQNSTYTKDASLSLVLFDDPNVIVASGTILSGTNNQNSVRVLVNSGNFEDYLDYPEGETILKSSDLSNTAGSEIIIINQLSNDIEITKVDENIAIVEVSDNHDFAEGDIVDIRIDPDPTTTETTYYVTKQKFQDVDLIPLPFNGKLNDTGIGQSTLIGLGRDYTAGTYEDVELIFSNYSNVRENVGSIGDSGNAKATIVVEASNFDGSGNISSIVITDAGSNYTADDILTINPNEIPKIDPSDLDIDVDADAVLINGNTVTLFQQRKFSVSSAAYPALVANVLPNLGEVFQNDAETVDIIYLDTNPDEYTVTYGLINPAENITLFDTFDGISLTNIFIDYPIGAPLPQYNFDVNGETNPDYEIRVGSTFTFKAIPDFQVYIVSEYTTTTASDFISQQIQTYNPVPGVANNGVQITTGDPAQYIEFTPTYPGVFYYISTSNPEAVGTITVYPAPSTSIPLLGVNNIGLGVDRNDCILDGVFGLSEGDYLKVNDEILQIIAVDSVTRKVSFDRGVLNTKIVNHPLRETITSYNPRYRFIPGEKLFGNNVNDPIVVSYNPETHRLVVKYEFNATNPRLINNISAFFDHSTPNKIVSVSKGYTPVDRIAFSSDNINYSVNPIIDIQKYYTYKFDTSHPSMVGEYFDVSPSKNFNVIAPEKEVSLVEPGNPGAFVKIRIGYGANIGSIESQESSYNFYYYFLSSPDIQTEQSYLRIKDDPLSGVKQIVYTSQNKFVYSLDDVPQYDGSGSIQYVGRSVGKIASIILDNLGSDYTSIPVVSGIVPASGFKAVIQCVRDISTNRIIRLDIIDPGQGYSKPKAVVSSGDGSGLEIELSVENGSIVKAEIIKSGSNYTFTPTLDIVETDNRIFFESDTIGVPQSVNFVRYGNGIHNDTSIISEYTSPFVYTVSNFELNSFAEGELIEQKIDGVVVASGTVSKNGWKVGSNILKLTNVIGTFRRGVQIVGNSRKNTATISSVLYSKFSSTVATMARALGVFGSDRGKISSTNQRITDSNFYQDYSYVIRSRTSINDWRNAVKSTTHPAGFKMFGEMYIESDSSIDMETNQNTSEKVTSFVILPTTSISSYATKRTITESILKVADTKVRRGQGSVAVDSFDETLTRVRDIELSPTFDGTYDENTGLKIGRKTFTIIDKQTGAAYAPYNEQELMITLDGIAQEPGKSFRISGNQIIFYEAPLGERIVEDQLIPGQVFYGRSFKFRENLDNEKYLKKLKDISNLFDGKQKQFDLYYENGDIVKTDLNENLLIYLDGVLQQNSYIIRRFKSQTKTDRIIFSKAPQNYADEIANSPKSLRNEQKFYGYNVGSYERLHIDQNIIPYNTSNSYLILDENNRVKTFDSPLYAFVFVDGVLQNHELSYKIIGPSIIFNQPLRYAVQFDGSFIQAKVDILYIYGKSSIPTLTFFDFESDVFFNRITMSFSGNGTYDSFAAWYGPYSSAPTYLYQNSIDGKNVLGQIIQVNNGSTWSLILRSQNLDFIDGSDVYFTRELSLNGQDDLVLSFDSVQIEYNTNASGDRILNRIESNYSPFIPTDDAYDSYDYRGILLKEHPSLKRGDLIRIDGELDYREITSTPIFAKSKNYNNGEQVSNSYFAKVAATQYNKDVFGEGFTVIPTISNGVVNSVSWNRRDLEIYFKNYILLNPTSYNYYTPPVINFIPVDGNGGGAKAEVLVHGGQVLDIVIVDGGNGYTKAPRAVISRGYNIIRTLDTFESTIKININEEVYSGITASYSSIDLYRRELMEHFVSLIAPTPNDIDRIVIRYIAPDSQQVTLPDPSFATPITKITQKDLLVDSIISVNKEIVTDYEVNIFASYQLYQQNVTKVYSTGVIDLQELLVENPSLFSQGKLGTTVGSFVDYLFMDVGYANVSGITLEQLELTYTQFEGISEGVNTWMENYSINDSSITSNGTLFNPGIPSIQELMTYLDAPLSDTGTVAYVPDTSNFPNSGKLLIGKEMITYTAKLSDRFYGITRGVNGTEAVAHNAGQFLRTTV
jgi:hypothetical protein